MSELMNRVVKIVLFTVLLQLPQLGHAGREFEMWDTLPQMENVIFSKTSVGFISIDQRYFILDRVSRSFKQVKEYFFYQQFPDRDAKKIAEVIKKWEHPSTVILRASKGMEFKTENAYCAEGTVMYSSYGWSKDKPFIPKEMNVLIPFFLDAAKSGEGRSKWIAMNNLRMFHSERIIDFFLDLEKSDPEGKGAEERAIRNGLDKYAKFGLMTSDQTAQRITLYLERIQEALAQIRSSHPNTSSVGGWSIVGSVQSLKKMGNLQGIQLINDYFVASDGNPRDGYLYDTILAQLYTCDELTPAVLEGLKKIQTEHTYRGCSFFDMRYRHLHGSRYDARYAEAILIALERAMKRKDWLGDIAVKKCTEAFKSQIRNTKVNEDFFSQIYPNLSGAQKDIADRLLLAISLPFDDTWRDGPDLTVESLFPPLIMAKGGNEIPIMDITVNAGDVSARPSVTQYYLSEDPAIDPVIDLLIGERAVPLLGPGESSDSGTQRFVLPAYLTEGLYFLGACADGSEAVKELNELNNCYINEPR